MKRKEKVESRVQLESTIGKRARNSCMYARMAAHAVKTKKVHNNKCHSLKIVVTDRYLCSVTLIFFLFYCFRFCSHLSLADGKPAMSSLSHFCAFGWNAKVSCKGNLSLCFCFGT